MADAKKNPAYDDLQEFYGALMIFFDEYIEAAEQDEDPAMLEYATNLRKSISEAMRKDIFNVLVGELVESGQLVQGGGDYAD